MKIRNDFVTNSSSSSFILAFKDEDSVLGELESECKGVERKYFDQLREDVLKAHRYTKDIILDDYKDGAEWEAMYEAREYAEKVLNMNYSEAWSFGKSEDGQKMAKEIMEKKIRDLDNKIGDKKVIVEVEYGDGGYGEDGVLEHDIVPYLPSCMATINNH